jgi:hypothetical protein
MMAGRKVIIQGDEQAALDAEEHRERMAAISAALDRVEECRGEMNAAKRLLQNRKRLYQEAQWEANAKIRQLAEVMGRRKARPSGEANGNG